MPEQLYGFKALNLDLGLSKEGILSYCFIAVLLAML